MKQLGGMDANFLNMESRSTYGHVSSMTIFEPKPGTGGAGLEVTRRAILSRIDQLEPYRRRLVTVPFGLDIPYWIEDPDHPLYSAGTELIHFYPVSTIADGMALNLTVQSYNGRLDFGFVGDRELVPDVWVLVDLLHESMAELHACALAAQGPSTKPPAAKKRPAVMTAPAAKKSAAANTASVAMSRRGKPAPRKSPAKQRAVAGAT